MGMTGTGMSTAVRAKINALSNADKLNQTKVMDAMWTGMVEYMQANAEVSVSGTGDYKTGTLTAAAVTVTDKAPGPPTTDVTATGTIA